MRVVLSVAVIVGLALIMVMFGLIAQGAMKRRHKMEKLKRELDMLRDMKELVANEVDVQIRAGYSDVSPFALVVKSYKELES